MKLPILRAGLNKLIAHARGIASLLVANPLLVAIWTVFHDALTALELRREEHDTAVQKTKSARHALRQAIKVLNAALQRFAHELKMAADNHYRSDRYRTYLPDGISEIETAPIEEKITWTQRILAQLATEPLEVLRNRVTELSEALASAIEAQRAYKEAQEAEEEASGVLIAEKARFIKSYRRAYNMLRLHFDDDPSKAEEYFPDLYRRTNGGEATDEPVGEDEEAGEAENVPANGETTNRTTAADGNSSSSAAA